MTTTTARLGTPQSRLGRIVLGAVTRNPMPATVTGGTPTQTGRIRGGTVTQPDRITGGTVTQ